MEIPLCLNEVFLDSQFPGWRRWCVVKGKSLGIPFTAQSRVTAANCEFIQSQRAHPSSWRMISQWISKSSKLGEG